MGSSSMFLLRGAFWIAFVVVFAPLPTASVSHSDADRTANAVIENVRQSAFATLGRVKAERERERARLIHGPPAR